MKCPPTIPPADASLRLTLVISAARPFPGRRATASLVPRSMCMARLSLDPGEAAAANRQETMGRQRELSSAHGGSGP